MLFNRRKFLKSTVAAGAFLATGVKFNFDAWANEQQQADVVLKGSYCNVCSSHCGMWIHVKNGRAWKVTGHKDHNNSKGKLCARAHGGLAWIYDQDRVKTPLKKVGPDKFEAISWEQAATEIGTKLKEIVANGESQGIFWGHNPRQTGAFYGPRFMNALGSNTVTTHNAACNTALTCGFANTIGSTPSADIGKTKYAMFIGRNYGEGIRTSQVATLTSAMAKGAKFVCVDPRLNATAALADEWIPIRPGTDLAFVLAMCHVLIKENLYDKKFIEEQTEGFDKFFETIDQYTPAWAAEITDIDAETIIRLARELASHKPNCVVDPSWKGAFGANYENSTETVRAVAYINALLGNIGQEGGLSLGSGLETAFGSLDKEKYPSPAKPDTPRLDGAGIKGEFPLAPTGPGLPNNIAKKAYDGVVKAGFIRNHNPVRNFPDYQFMKKGFENIDMLVVMETHMSETALCADYILPEPTFAEREEVVENNGKSICIRTIAVPKVHPETKGLDEIITLLAEKAGVGQYFNFTLDELNRARLAPLGVTLEELREKGTINVNTKPNSMKDKFKFYNEKFVEHGFDGVAGWVQPATGYKVGANQFRLLNGKQGYHSHTATANIPQLAQITLDYNSQRLWMNASKAAEMGIADGDWITLTSSLGTERAQIKVTEKIHPEALFAPGGYGNKTPYYKLSAIIGGCNPNDLIPHQMESISGHGMMQEVIVTAQKA